MSAAIKQDIAALGFEQALKELEVIVRQLESGEITLEDSIEAYAKGVQLQQHCQHKLESARLKVEQVCQQGQDIQLKSVDIE